jgi:hypothetical protein
MATDKSDLHYEKVTGGTEVLVEQTPADGAEWRITKAEGIAPSSSDGWVAVVWDYEGDNEEILFLTYTSSEKQLSRTITGDGTKKLTLVLHNDGGSDLYMGCGYEAKEL